MKTRRQSCKKILLGKGEYLVLLAIFHLYSRINIIHSNRFRFPFCGQKTTTSPFGIATHNRKSIASNSAIATRDVLQSYGKERIGFLED